MQTVTKVEEKTVVCRSGFGIATVLRLTLKTVQTVVYVIEGNSVRIATVFKSTERSATTVVRRIIGV